MATHSSILAWRIPWTGEPGGLQFMASQRVGQDRAADTNTHTHKHTHCGFHFIEFACIPSLFFLTEYASKQKTRKYEVIVARPCFTDMFRFRSWESPPSNRQHFRVLWLHEIQSPAQTMSKKKTDDWLSTGSSEAVGSELIWFSNLSDSFSFVKNNFMFSLFLAVLGLHRSQDFFSSCGTVSRDDCLVVHRLLVTVAFLAVERGL